MKTVKDVLDRIRYYDSDWTADDSDPEGKRLVGCCNHCKDFCCVSTTECEIRVYMESPKGQKHYF